MDTAPKIAESDRDGWKIVGVAMIQSAGILFSMFLLYFCGKRYGEMAPKLYLADLAVLTGALFTGILKACSAEPLLDFLRKIAEAFLDLKSRPPRKSTRKELVNTLRIMAAVDFIAFGFCIVTTGGSEESVYAPLLFIVVPILIIVKVLNWKEILVFAAISGLIFSFGLFPVLCNLVHPLAMSYQSGSPFSHAIMLGISTVLCTLSPVVYAALEQWAGEQTAVARTEPGEPGR